MKSGSLGLWLLACLWSCVALAAEPPAPVWHWVDSAGRPTTDAALAVATLARAADEGLDANDYRLPLAAGVTPEDLATWDGALQAALLRYLRDLHLGRVDARALGFRLADRRSEHDIAALLVQARAEGRLAGLLAELTPQLPPYGHLREALARYRALAADTTRPPIPALNPALVGPAARVRPGERWAGLPAVRSTLAALGDLPRDEGVDDPLLADMHDDALVGAVQRFQQRHGLADDGVIGPATLAELRLPLARRVRQIELAMERLRWLPHLSGPLGVAVNIPMFRLQAWEAGAPQRRLGMGVIVGKALDTRTPVFVDEMTHLIFRPFWNVPRSIVRNEVLPGLARDPGYLARKGLEIVQGGGDDARVVAVTPASIEQLRLGVLRLRQPPGPANALGLVKFIFPNDADVYLHDTPTRSLFGRPRRDFSHGCVRVEDPVALAEWLLADQPGWGREAIVAAMNGGRTLRVDLTRPVPVVLYYLTAFVAPDDGRVHFAADLYRHDQRLEAALARRR